MGLQAQDVGALAPVPVPVLAPVLAPVVAPADASSGAQPGKLAKLVKKFAKREQRSEATQVEFVAAQAAQVMADADHAKWLAEPTTPKKVVKKAAHKAKKAAKTVSRLRRRMGRLLKKLGVVRASIEQLDPDYFEVNVPASDASLDVPVLIQTAQPPGVIAVPRIGAVATFGLPVPRAAAVQELGGRPALGVVGANVYQFKTLDTWPEGTVRWALVDVFVDSLAQGLIKEGLVVTAGGGASAGGGLQSIGQVSPSKILLDTGPLQAIIQTDAFNLFQSVTVDGQLVSYSDDLPGVVARGTDGQVLLPGPDTHVFLEENGPARAVVRADGSLTGPLGFRHVDFTCRIIARRESRDLEIDFTVRNATASRSAHAIVESIQLAAAVRTLSQPLVRVATHDGEHVQSLGTSSSSRALLYQAYSSAATSGLGGAQYRPHLPTLPNDPARYVQEGYQLNVDGQAVHWLGDATEYPAQPYLDLSGPVGGVTVAIQNMAHLWPASLEARGSGVVLAGLFPGENPADYTFVWRQHESRKAVFSFHSAEFHQPFHVPLRLAAPVTGRAADYAYYDDAGVFPYELLTTDEQEQALAFMGIAHDIQPGDSPLRITRYLYKGTTGGTNNAATIESGLAGDWLRHGAGGRYLNALDLATYKSEWQVPRSDDFHDRDDPGPTNNFVPHSTGHFGDDEHRYREGMVLAYYLTGEPRFRDALFDEAEVLAGVNLWQHERSMYQTVRAMALVAEFTDDTDLIHTLRQRLLYFTTPVVNVDQSTGGWGWAGPPGQLSHRGYYVNSSDNDDEKPPGENFQARGFISASLGPLALYHAARVLPDQAIGEVTRARMRDLSRWTRDELFPNHPDPAQQRLVYSYAVTLRQVTNWENTDYHPILMGMAETWRDTGELTYLAKGVQQLRAAREHGDLHRWNTRLDVQHFLSMFRDWALQQ